MIRCQPLFRHCEGQVFLRDLNGQDIWPGSAGIFTRSDGLVDWNVKAFIESSLHIFSVQQRPRRNAKRKIDGLTKDGIPRLAHFLENLPVREGSKRALSEVFFVGPLWIKEWYMRHDLHSLAALALFRRSALNPPALRFADDLAIAVNQVAA